MTGRSTAILLMVAAVTGGRAYARDQVLAEDGGGRAERSAAPSQSAMQPAADSGMQPASDSAMQHAGPLTDAQSRRPRPGTGSGDRSSPRFEGSRGSSYDPFGYRPYYSGRYYDYGYSPYYYSSYYNYAPYYPRGQRYYRESGSIRVLVDPENTRVYVDGYYAGVSDDFDGILQRLHIPPGRHEISLKLDGYRSHRFKVYVPVDQTLKIHHEMVRGDGEETEEVLGRPAGYVRDDDRDLDLGSDRDESETAGDQSRRGTLRLDLRPADASVYVDGSFRGSGHEARTLRLAVGTHRVEVVRPGFRTVEREVEVSGGLPTELKVDLERY